MSLAGQLFFSKYYIDLMGYLPLLIDKIITNFQTPFPLRNLCKWLGDGDKKRSFKDLQLGQFFLGCWEIILFTLHKVICDKRWLIVEKPLVRMVCQWPKLKADILRSCLKWTNSFQKVQVELSQSGSACKWTSDFSSCSWWSVAYDLTSVNVNFMQKSIGLLQMRLTMAQTFLNRLY